MDNLPETVVVGHVTYTLRQFTPKRKGEHAGHGWVREVGHGGIVHRSEVGAESLMLIDEIVRLRGLVEQ